LTLHPYKNIIEFSLSELAKQVLIKGAGSAPWIWL